MRGLTRQCSGFGHCEGNKVEEFSVDKNSVLYK